MDKHWTPWLFVEVGAPLAPLGMAVAAAWAGTRPFDWTEDVWWGNELPFMALALCIPSFLGIFKRVGEAKEGGWGGEFLWGAGIAMGLLLLLPAVMLFVFYLDKFKVLELTVKSVGVKSRFCLAMTVPISVGLVAKGILRYRKLYAPTPSP